MAYGAVGNEWIYLNDFNKAYNYRVNLHERFEWGF